MGACRIDPAASPQFNVLREHWKSHGYPSLDSDLEEAYEDIRKEVLACRCRVVQRFSVVLGNFKLHKYRHKNRAAREGAKGGWRLYALFDASTATLYPVIVYPKKEWEDAADDKIINTITELTEILKQRSFPSN